MSLSVDLLKKKEHAVDVLRSFGSAVVALSGGVDSATLLAVAREALGADRILAVTGRSDAVGEDEIADAAGVAKQLGVRHEVVDTFEMEREAYRANAGDRCFHCRSELFGILRAIAGRGGRQGVVYGAIVDDLSDDRPGMKAAVEFGVGAPFLDARIGKSDVRALAIHYDLHVSEKPASACLASRIPVGTEVTPERLSQVGRAEVSLRNLGFRQVRVRHHGEIGRIELGEGEAGRLSEPRLRDDVVAAVRAAGFRYAVLDLEPYGKPSTEGRREPTLHSILPAREGGQ
jgi:uncharacterized protein